MQVLALLMNNYWCFSIFIFPSCDRLPIFESSFLIARLATMKGFGSLVPKTKNLIVAGGLSGFVLGVYYYTMRAVGGTDELQVAIDKFEHMKTLLISRKRQI